MCGVEKFKYNKKTAEEEGTTRNTKRTSYRAGSHVGDRRIGKQTEQTDRGCSKGGLLFCFWVWHLEQIVQCCCMKIDCAFPSVFVFSLFSLCPCVFRPSSTGSHGKRDVDECMYMSPKGRKGKERDGRVLPFCFLSRLYHCVHIKST